MCTVPSVYLLVVCFLTFLYFFVKYVCAFENYCLFVYLHICECLCIFFCVCLCFCVYMCVILFICPYVYVWLCLVFVSQILSIYFYTNKLYPNISLLLLLHLLLSPQLSWLSPGHCRDLEQSYNSQLSEIGIMTGNMKWISVIWNILFKIFLVFCFCLINNCLRNYLWNE